ncbi:MULTISPECIES: DNA cytosine methyltransferase [Enterobacter]|uniref:DNA cytosine methyltransferase n=1 Tax=Enterobacter TaxID=547 RepID=UPI00069E2576|nr:MULTISPECIES: DNA cytosine methyltransferase [Enterobacter]MCQ4452280.1 DNA cytosine methyltransferase [Enterobacter asburiae]MCY1147613.1 DNA cytosine methyltransferase [Enterobacter asburiae]SAB05900.1 BsuMI modification methylase subunit ydiP [Enterobacter asburiae]HDC4509297.1 DNA cytosine methyltransferase [Enterobacter asburiae]HDW2004924.1 DNA cytosine methyltransferase [Enterobacter asburiae]
MNKPVSYGSVCSGIEAASVAWHCLGWQPAWFAEIEKFPSAVLAYRWPDVSNLGDMTQIAAAIRAGKIEAPDVLVGGTPCQAFSVAGLRNGLAGESCALESPGKRWSNAGYVLGPERAIAWRVLDAQFFGVAQRRRRVFVVATARGDIDPAKILFESEGLRRNSPPSRKTRQILTSDAGYRVANGSHWDGEHNPHPTLNQSFNTGGIGASNQELFSQRGSGIVGAFRMRAFGDYASDETASTVKARDHKDATDLAVTYSDVSRTLLAKSNDSMDETLQTYAIHGTQDPDTLADMAHTLGRNHGQENAVIAFSSKDSGHDASAEVSPTLRAGNSKVSNQNAGSPPAVAYCIPGNWIGRAPHNGGNSTESLHQISPCLTATDHHGVVYAFVENTQGQVRLQDGDGQITGPLSTGGGKPGQGYPAIAYAFKGGQGAKAHGIGYACEQAPTLTSANSGSNQAPAIMQNMAVRRLTPVECERLQGFPDNHTLIPTQKRKQLTAEEYAYLRHHRPELTAEQAFLLAADGPRYKAIGNSMAVPVMRWIGSRIQEALRA